MTKTAAITLCLLGSIEFAACQADKAVAQKPAVQQPARPAYVQEPDAAVNDAARFLAGLPGREASAFKPLEQNPAWVEHAKVLDGLWARFEKSLEPGMEKFQRGRLSGPPFDRAVVFYPFSGADVLTMLTLFPSHDNYVMAALEPPGQVPQVGEFSPETLESQLPAIRKTLSSLFNKSFFVTREMDRQLRGQIVDGVMVPMLILLAREGYTIDSNTYIQLDAAGAVVRRDPEERRAAFGHNRGLAFEVRRGSGPRQFIHYISLNLDDNHMRDNAAFKEYTNGLGPLATMLKATSYMLHAKNFTQIRDLILKDSAAIVQDDSGIPYRFFSADQWTVTLFGDYVEPYGSFKYRRQPDLREAYEKKDGVQDLGFRIGYGSGHVTSNLQVAIRKS
jgi:hypothetical protein